jgi:hypothetical protein
MYGKIAELTNGTYSVAVEQTFTDGNGTVVVVHRQTAERLDNRQALVFKIVGGKVVSLTDTSDDISIDDNFYSGTGARWRRAPCPALATLLDGDGLLRALPHGLLALLAEIVGRILLQDVEEVVVTDLEDFRDDTHADGVALAEVEVDHDLPGHCASLWLRGRC